jgi:ABC-type sugar transport system substrate-binding protein
LALVALGATAALVAAGCGSSDSSSSSSTAGGSTAAATSAASDSGAKIVEQARADLAQVTSDPPEIDVPPLDKPAPTGKTVLWAGCPLPVCVATGKGVEEAAQALGWKFRQVNLGFTPQTVQSAWNAIVQDPPDAIAAVGILPNSAIKKQLEALKGIPYVGVTQQDPPDDLMPAATAPPAQMEGDGQAMADWVLVDSDGDPGEILYVWDPAVSALVGARDGFHAQMQKLCPDCKITDLKVASADAGSKIPAAITTQLRRSPDIEYVVFNLGDLAAGVPQAIKGASLPSTPKIVTRAATTTNMADIENGDLAAALTSEVPESGWRAADLLVRLMNGQELYDDAPSGERTFLTQDNLPADITKQYTIPDYQQAFEQAGGK